MWLSWLLLTALLVAACAADVRTRRIPNPLVVTGLIAGLALQALAPAGGGLFDALHFGGLGLLAGAQAAVAMLVATCLLWRLRVFAAGDAKLMTAASAFFGPAGVVPLLVVMLAAGGVLALAALLGASFMRAGGTLAAASPLSRLPYSVAIAAACLVVAAAPCALWAH